MSQRAPASPVAVEEGPGVRPSLLLTIFTWLAESTLAYTILGYIVPYITPSADFDPLFVLAPYGLALATVLALAATWGLASAFAGRYSARSIHLPLSLDLPLSHLILSAAAVGVAILYVASFLVVMLAVTWWEMYRGWNLVDPTWLGVFLEDTNGATALSWLWGLGLLIWWRGSYVARARVDSSGTTSRFLMGLVLALAMTLWGGITSVGRIDISALLGAYLLFGLAAVAAARLDVTPEGREGGVDSSWRWRSLLLSSLLVAFGFGIVVLVLPVLAELASWLWTWVASSLLPALIEAIRWLAHLLGLDQPPEYVPPPPAEEVPSPPRMTESPLTPPEWLGRLARAVFVLSWIGLILFAIYASLRHRFRLWGARSGGNATRERVPWGLRSWLVTLLLSLLRLLASRWPSLSRWTARLAARDEAAWTVRRVYRKLLAWGASRGSAREAWATPAEYEALLSTRWPALSPEFRLITESYVEVRYGGATATEESLEAVLLGWLRIEATHAESGDPGPRPGRGRTG